MCSKCGEDKPLSEFHRDGQKLGGLRPDCKDCVSTRTKQRAAATTAWMRQIKLERGCTDCGYNDNPVALQFDHIEDNKEFDIGSGSGRNRDALEKEIAKCEVVCANCHAIRTYERNSN